MMNSEVRGVDRARATRMIAAQVMGDPTMFATALQETLDDDWGFGEFGSLINVLRVMSEDLGEAIVSRYGEAAPALVRHMLVQHAASGTD